MFFLGISVFPKEKTKIEIFQFKKMFLSSFLIFFLNFLIFVIFHLYHFAFDTLVDGLADCAPVMQSATRPPLPKPLRLSNVGPTTWSASAFSSRLPILTASWFVHLPSLHRERPHFFTFLKQLTSHLQDPIV